MGSLPGIIRTRVGYAGGKQKDPTYHSIGDHTETFQLDYDPEKITYRQLLQIFWNTHNPCQKSWSRQYMSAIFFSNDEQRKLAEETRDEIAKKKGPVHTVIAPLEKFYDAEDYHQKYYLRGQPDLLAELIAYYPNAKDFMNSTAAARVNSYVSGHGDPKQLERELPSLGLSEVAARRLMERLRRRGR